MIIKICGMRDSVNIKEIAKLNPDWLGFIFYPKSKRYVGIDFNPEIVLSLMPDIQTVGVFVNEDFENLMQIAGRFHFSLLQLHGNESPEYCINAGKEGYKIMKAFGIHSEFDWNTLNAYAHACDYFLFDTSTKNYGGSGQKFDWDILSKYNGNKPFLLSGGITPEDVQQIKQIKYPAFAGIDINSGFEIEPGLKDTNKAACFIKEIRTTKI
jgi:phosphoribosylanthranilate isomerase